MAAMNAPLVRLLGGAAIAAGWGAFWRSYYRVEIGSDEVHRATTADGWRVALTRYRPARDAPARRHPVVLCHGLAANRVSFDLDPEVSLARFLAARGWDVWSLELRGHGSSDRPKLGTGRRFGWTFDDYLQHDAPAALQHVLQDTGATRVHWIGHSMGGILLYALIASGAPMIRSGIAVGSGLDYTRGPSDFGSMAPLRGLGAVLPALPLGVVALMASPLMGRIDGAVDQFNVHRANVDPTLFRRLNASTFHAVSGPLLTQLASVFDEGGLASRTGERYLDLLQGKLTPVMALAGTKDRQCPPQTAQVPIDALGSPDSHLVTFGRAHGHREDYGHFDLLIGRRVVDEVFGVITRWLDRQDAIVRAV